MIENGANRLVQPSLKPSDIVFTDPLLQQVVPTMYDTSHRTINLITYT